MPTAALRPILAILFAGVLVGALDIAIVGPALPDIQATFGVDSRALSWVYSVYVLFYVVGAPLLAKLSDRTGRRAVYAQSLALFAARIAARRAGAELRGAAARARDPGVRRRGHLSGRERRDRGDRSRR